MSISGLTELLFALFISLSLLLTLKKQTILSACLISFLPFIRSEGLIIIGVVSLYYVFIKELKYILYLSLGTIIYSIAGYFFYNDIFWVFTKIPYANMTKLYGSGTILHFFEQLNYVIGIPIYILFGIGLLYLFFKFLKKQLSFEILFLVIGSFLAFFVAHSVFWYLGIFNSFGMKRVLIAVIPLIIIIAMYGIQFIMDTILHKKIKKGIVTIILIYIVIFPFTSNPAAYNKTKDFELENSQQNAYHIYNFLERKNLIQYNCYFDFCYFFILYNNKSFEDKQHTWLYKERLQQLSKNDIIIWDNWYAQHQYGISLDTLIKMEQQLRLKKIFEVNSSQKDKFIIYQAL